MKQKSKKPQTTDPPLCQGINIAALLLIAVTLIVGAACQNQPNPLLNGVSIISPPQLLPLRKAEGKRFERANDGEICPVIKIVNITYHEADHAFEFELEMKNSQATTLKVKNFVISNENGMIRGTPSIYLYNGFDLPTDQRNKFIFRFPLNERDLNQESIFSNVSLSVIDNNDKELCTVTLQLSITLFEHRLSFLAKYFARAIRILLIGNQGVGKTSVTNTLLTCFVSDQRIIITSGQVGRGMTGVATTVKVGMYGEETMPVQAREHLSPWAGLFKFLDTVGYTNENDMHKQVFEILISGTFPPGWNQKDSPFVGREGSFGSEKPDVIIFCLPYASANNAEIKNSFEHIGKEIALTASRHNVPLFLGVTLADELLDKSESEVDELLSEAKNLFGNVLVLDTYSVRDTKRRFMTDLRSQDVLLALSQKVDTIQLEATASQKVPK